MQEAFSYSFPAPAWRLLFEQAADAPGRLLVEWRDGAARRLGITLLSLPDGTCLSDPAAGLPWTSAVLGLWNGLALYHHLGNERLPVPTALGSYDPQSAQSRWEWPHHLLLACDGQQVEARPTAPAEGQPPSVYFDLFSGRPQPAESHLTPRADRRATHPVLYLPTSSHWPLLTRFVQKTTGQTPHQRLHYAEIDDKIVFSYYVYAENGPPSAFLLVADRQGQLRLHRPLQLAEAAANGTDPTAFGVWQNLLLVVTNPIQLTGFSLTN